MTKNTSPETQTDQRLIIPTEQSGFELVEMINTEDDRKLLDFQNSQPEHIAEFGNTIHKSEEDVTIRREKITKKGGRDFWMRKDGVDIGWAGFTPSGDDRDAEIGLIVAQESSGNGYGTIAMKALTDYLKDDYESITVEARSDHVASIRIFEKLGYVEAGNVSAEWAGTVGATVLKYYS